MRAQTIKIFASILVISGALAFLLADTLMADPEALTYFHDADVVIVQPEKFHDQRIRMGGLVQIGSIFQKSGTLEYQFDVRPVPAMVKFPEAMGKTVTVKYQGIVPDTFKDDATVIVTGVLGHDGVFVAQDLSAKCPSKYEAEEKNR